MRDLQAAFECPPRVRLLKAVLFTSYSWRYAVREGPRMEEGAIYHPRRRQCFPTVLNSDAST